MNKINILKKISLIFFFQIFISNFSYSETIKKFDISGNVRVSDETILMFSNLEIGDEIDQSKLNAALKELYYTDYFNDVKISKVNGTISIIVKENPIIQKIIVNGVKDKKLNEIIDEVTSSIDKYPLIESKISDQINLLKNIFKSYGYYFVELEASIKKNENNTVDLTYNFDLGEIAKIKKINFIGNKIFSDGTLRNIIISEEDKFWKFITRNKFLDSNRINADVFRLENFYKNRGYYNVKIKSTSAIINNANQFEIIFNINSGEKYYFDDVQIINNNNVQIENFKIFQDKFSKL